MNARQTEIYNDLVKQFDARDRVYELLEDLHRNGKQIPARFLADWNAHLRDKRKWRNIPGMDRKIRHIARRMAKNEKRLPSQNQKKTDNYLKKQMRKLGREGA